MEMNNLEIFYNNMSTFKDTSFDKAAFLRSKNNRRKVNYILVYNESKNLSEETEELGKIDQESSKTKIAKHFTKKAKKKFVRFDLGKFEGLYFKEVFTFTEKEFEKEFLSKI